MPDDPAYADGAAFMDGAYMPVAECKIPVLDWGFLRGDATYDVVHTWNGRFFRLTSTSTASRGTSGACTTTSRTSATTSPTCCTAASS